MCKKIKNKNHIRDWLAGRTTRKTNEPVSMAVKVKVIKRTPRVLSFKRTGYMHRQTLVGNMWQVQSGAHYFHAKPQENVFILTQQLAEMLNAPPVSMQTLQNTDGNYCAELMKKSPPVISSHPGTGDSYAVQACTWGNATLRGECHQ